MAMELIKIDKVTLHCGVGAAGEELESAKALLERISGRKAVLTKAKSRNPTFKIKEGDNIGTKVTLRRMAGEGAMDVSILGPWDTDLPRRRYSYQTAMAQALLGKVVGDTATLRLEGDDTQYEIVGIAVAEF